MAKGKFEAPKKKPGVPQKENPKPEKTKTEKTGAGAYAAPAEPKKFDLRKLWIALAALGGVALIVVGVVLLSSSPSRPTPGSSTVEPTVTEIPGMPRAELEQKAEAVNRALRSRDLVLTLNETAEDGRQAEEPIVLTISPDQSRAGLDLSRLRTDLDAGKGKKGSDSFSVDLTEYLTVDEAAVRGLIKEVTDAYGGEYVQTDAKVVTEIIPYEPDPTETPPETDPEQTDAPEEPTEASDGEPEESTEPTEPEPTEPLPTEMEAQFLVVRLGKTGRTIDAEELESVIRDAYRKTAAGGDAAEEFSLELPYEKRVPAPVDADLLFEKYCTRPVDARLDSITYEIIPDVPGFGFNVSEFKALAEGLGEGEEIKVRMRKLNASMSAERLLETMYQDVLAEAHTVHSLIPARTNNLKLACAAIDGTVVLPGHVFSFNETVGERTKEKGYLEAIAYVEGGASRPETGGGVCQVASSIYYAVLQADLKTVQRAPHMYLVDYVPPGMDAAIYWGQLDYKFENTSPYPIKISASVSDGKVHIILYGTEWKKYDVEMSWEILETTPWEVREEVVPYDGTHYYGEVLSTPYTGYKVVTYKTTYYKSGDKIETVRVAYSTYNKRDKVIAVFAPTPPPTTEPPVTYPVVPTPTDPPAPAPTDPPAPAPTDPPAPAPTDPPPTDPPAPEPTSEPEP